MNLSAEIGPVMARHNELGKAGEEAAVALLAAKGMRIEARNWRSGRNELDIVATDGAFIVFVEVKSRSTSHFGKPDEFIGLAQQRRLIAAANAYMEEHCTQLEARFDAVSVVMDGERLRTFHIREAFHPGLAP